MLRVTLCEVMNLEGALRGMRNAMESWSKSDSFVTVDGECIVGENDLKLALSLVKAGSDHRKFMRQILVSCDITAPLYWWKEFDTYKVGTVANSESTMHKLGSRPLTLSDFSWDYRSAYRNSILHHLNGLIDAWRNTKDRVIWRELIQDLPSSFNQTRTVTLNYEVLYSIYHSRKGHKLTEWHTLCDWIEELPYSELITFE